MKLKIVQNYEADFTLEPTVKEILFSLLTNESFLQQVSQQAQSSSVEFTEILFQPVPYSLSTPKGMPAQFEQYHNNEDYIIINIPPNFMFKAKIFNPSRLCAIYRKLS